MDREARLERLYVRACAILDGLANGFGEPILWHLALRCYTPAMVMLANRLSGAETRAGLGRPGDGFSAAGMYYRAWRSGDHLGALNLAITCFNMGDLQGYRHWLRRAGRGGDAEAAAEARRFETRLPHGMARLAGRGRPYRRTER
jgi:hypothetical protein